MIRHYALWAATQAQRPKEDPHKEYLLRAKDVAENYEKVRIADFVASLNQTPNEKRIGILRLHVDIYRSNESDIVCRLVTDFRRMIFHSKTYGTVSRSMIPDWARRRMPRKKKVAKKI